MERPIVRIASAPPPSRPVRSLVISSEARNLATSATAARSARSNRFARGFTLIELVVILLVLTITFGMIGINLTRDDTDILRDEGDRLAVLIQAAHEEAIMQARPFALTPVREGYQFLRLGDDNKLQPIQPGDLLAPRKLAHRIAIDDFEVEGAKKEEDPILIFEPSGVVPAFTIVLHLQQTRWYVQGHTNGKVCSTRNPLTEADWRRIAIDSPSCA